MNILSLRRKCVAVTVPTIAILLGLGILSGCGFVTGIVGNVSACKELRAEALQKTSKYTVPAPLTPKPRSPAESAEKRLAGAFRVDITPPPGFPMGGSGFAATFGRGYWTRLYARAFFFRDPDGQTLVLVSCDLASIPGGLQAKVAECLNERDPRRLRKCLKERKSDPSAEYLELRSEATLRVDLNLTRENLILAATHTHQGPGNFFSAKLYNEQASPASGYDRTLYDHLVRRITYAVRRAAQDAQGGKGETTWLEVRSGDVSSLLRNRAPDPFMLNGDRNDVLSGPIRPECANTSYPIPCPRYRAVNGEFSVLEIFRGKEKDTRRRTALLLFLSVHPEVLSETALYQTDFTGLAMQLIEKRNGEHFVAGFFNGAEGDVSADWKRRNHNEVRDFANRLVGAVESSSLPSESLEPELRIHVASDELVANPYFESPPLVPELPRYCAEKGRRCLARKPINGAATVGGAEDARTSLYGLGWKEGQRKRPERGQGMKLRTFESKILLGADLTPLIGPDCYYPERFRLSLVSFRTDSGEGRLTFGVVPAELTVMSWNRIAVDLMKRKLGRILPIGLANDYITYVTTREEYAAQAYEGASNVFGPHTAEVMKTRLVSLVSRLHPPVHRDQGVEVESSRYYPASRRDLVFFGPDWLGQEHPDPDEGIESLIVDEKDQPYRYWPRFVWKEPKTVNDWNASLRRVEIWRSDGSKKEEDRDGNILTVHLNPEDDDEDQEEDEGEDENEDFSVPEGKARRIRVTTPRSYPRAQYSYKGPRRWMAIWLRKNRQAGERYWFKVRGSQGAFTFCSDQFDPAEPMIVPVEMKPCP